MTEYINSIGGLTIPIKKHVEIALFEYDEMYIGNVKGGKYLGTVSQIYDNVNGDEKQGFVLTKVKIL